MFATSAITPFSVGSISAGALLGTVGTADLVNSINESLGGSNFFSGMQDAFSDIRNSFIESVIRPLQLGATTLASRVNILMNPDTFRPLLTAEDFTAVPPCMYEPIVMYAPVRSLLEQGLISGFGYDPAHLPKEDVYGRLIENGVCRDVLDSVDENGEVWLYYHFESTDPDLSFDELDAIEQTRDAIDRLLQNTRIDPTDAMEERG